MFFNSFQRIQNPHLHLQTSIPTPTSTKVTRILTDQGTPSPHFWGLHLFPESLHGLYILHGLGHKGGGEKSASDTNKAEKKHQRTKSKYPPITGQPPNQHIMVDLCDFDLGLYLLSVRNVGKEPQTYITMQNSALKNFSVIPSV